MQYPYFNVLLDSKWFTAKAEEYLKDLDPSLKQCDKAGILLKASTLPEKLSLKGVKGSKCAFVIANPDMMDVKIAIQPTFMVNYSIIYEVKSNLNIYSQQKMENCLFCLELMM